MNEPKVVVLLYYKFTQILNPKELRNIHQLRCLELGLKGRVIIASEGINGTVAGTREAISRYQAFIESLPEFKGIEWKEDVCERVPFVKMKTKVRKFLVNLGLPEISSYIHNKTLGATYLEPHAWREVLENEKDYVLLDVRNRYESKVGRFENAIAPDLEQFHNFSSWLQALTPYKDKKVLMYCTGGIRCEKFSPLLSQEGFKNLYQLRGGILNYIKKEQGAHFEGSCFVFDDRLSVRVHPEALPISNCHFCGKPEDRFLNCSDMQCNQLFICCDDCAHEHEGTCSEKCASHPTKRPFDPEHFRIPFRKKGFVFPELGMAKKK